MIRDWEFGSRGSGEGVGDGGLGELERDVGLDRVAEGVISWARPGGRGGLLVGPGRDGGVIEPGREREGLG